MDCVFCDACLLLICALFSSYLCDVGVALSGLLMFFDWRFLMVAWC